MSLLKTLIRSFVGAGKTGFRVGKKYSKLVELNVSLRIERDKKKNYYKEIGEFVHNYKENDSGYAGKITAHREAIVECERKIIRLIDEINNLKKINSCKVCGSVYKEGANFCLTCGAKSGR